MWIKILPKTWKEHKGTSVDSNNNIPLFMALEKVKGLNADVPKLANMPSIVGGSPNSSELWWVMFGWCEHAPKQNNRSCLLVKWTPKELKLAKAHRLVKDSVSGASEENLTAEWGWRGFRHRGKFQYFEKSKNRNWSTSSNTLTHL